MVLVQCFQPSAKPRLRLLTTLISRCSSSTASKKMARGFSAMVWEKHSLVINIPKRHWPKWNLEGKGVFTMLFSNCCWTIHRYFLTVSTMSCRLSSFQVRDAVVPHPFDGLLQLPSSNPKLQWKLNINVFPFSSHLNGEFPMYDFRKVKPEFFLQIAPKTQSLLLKIVPIRWLPWLLFSFKAPVEVLHWRIGATQCPNASFGHTKDGRV